MPRYYLHIANRVGFARDEEGIDLDDLAAAAEQAREGIHSIVSDEARQGRIDLDGRVEIADEAGKILQVVRFADAFEMMAPASQAWPEK